MYRIGVWYRTDDTTTARESDVTKNAGPLYVHGPQVAATRLRLPALDVLEHTGLGFILRRLVQEAAIAEPCREAKNGCVILDFHVSEVRKGPELGVGALHFIKRAISLLRLSIGVIHTMFFVVIPTDDEVRAVFVPVLIAVLVRPLLFSDAASLLAVIIRAGRDVRNRVLAVHHSEGVVNVLGNGLCKREITRAG